MTEAQVHRYSRQLVLGDIGGRGQRRLLAAAVRLELGADRPAAHCALAYLAAAGVGRIEIGGDPDGPVTPAEVDGSLLLEAGDAGRPRLETLRERVAALNPDVELGPAGDAPAIEVAEPGAGPDALIAGSRAAAAAIAGLAREAR